MIALLFGVVVLFMLIGVIYFFCSSVLNNVVNFGCSWGSVYECGFFSSVLNLNCFSFTYFFLLVMFVVFDLEISLLLNMFGQGLLFYNFFYYYFFLVILFLGFIVELFSGYVRWLY
uniref:NADH-ubiquinone oxidoreductase chain 3 n=1 Tax=Taenia hydatigena TaxID=85431 RepID=A0A8A2EYZ6_TAEHY|nr:NADH dehydrogenase subunit 3 [Taenia hydatigena]QSV08849.1 NADH dehydrogenase subunit 3 [Taenia hydatigena]QSV08861.1 NADH dehydrogenase subunit 3 [Taenia hydatigena]QSV08873.1 NADH dehydrogenase subunit 3 [Taenia hydatigena]QSV08885.1 NADH dehydrogenase subunit 3 [Taenia hydatigena]